VENKMRKTVIIFLICIAACCQILLAKRAGNNDFGRLVYQKDSLYHRIFVYRLGPIVTLQFGRRSSVSVQSQVNLDDLRQHMIEYTELVFCGLLYEPQPQKMLVLGLGGGVIPRDMHYYLPELEIDVVEIDPAVPQIAKRFFKFRDDDNLRVHIDDGRMFIKKQLRLDPVPKYDIIILDAFNGDYIPFHLMTKEFLEELKAVLADDGVVVANVFSNNRLYDAQLKTFLGVFGRCQVFLGIYSSNAILTAPAPAGRMLTVKGAVGRAKMLQGKHKMVFDMLQVAKRLMPNPRPDRHAKVLTDDKAPVNWLKKQKRGR